MSLNIFQALLTIESNPTLPARHIVRPKFGRNDRRRQTTHFASSCGTNRTLTCSVNQATQKRNSQLTELRLSSLILVLTALYQTNNIFCHNRTLPDFYNNSPVTYLRNKICTKKHNFLRSPIFSPRIQYRVSLII